MAVSSSDMQRSVSILINTVNLSTCTETHNCTLNVHANSHRLSVGFKQSKNSFTVLDERLGACESSMNCRQMKRAFPITTLRKHQEMFSRIKHKGFALSVNVLS